MLQTIKEWELAGHAADGAEEGWGEREREREAVGIDTYMTEKNPDLIRNT